MALDVIAETDLTSAVKISTWLGLAVAVLMVLVRLSIKLRIIRKTGLDDVCIVIALMLAVAQSISISLATANGLGSTRQLSDSEVTAQLKSLYSAALLFVTSCYFAKISFLLFIQALTPAGNYRKFGECLGFYITLWALLAVLVTAFQSRLPEPWNIFDNKYFDTIAFQSHFAVNNALTDAGLVALPFRIISTVRIARKQKVALLFAVSLRLITIAPILCQVIFISSTKSQEDRILVLAPEYISIQWITCLSISSACVLYLKPLLESLESGVARVSDLRRQHAKGHNGSPEANASSRELNSETSPIFRKQDKQSCEDYRILDEGYPLQTPKKESETSRPQIPLKVQQEQQQQHSLLPPPPLPPAVPLEEERKREADARTRSPPGRSDRDTHSNQLEILQTREWSIEYQNMWEQGKP